MILLYIVALDCIRVSLYGCMVSLITGIISSLDPPMMTCLFLSLFPSLPQCSPVFSTRDNSWQTACSTMGDTPGLLSVLSILPSSHNVRHDLHHLRRDHHRQGHEGRGQALPRGALHLHPVRPQPGWGRGGDLHQAGEPLLPGLLHGPLRPRLCQVQPVHHPGNYSQYYQYLDLSQSITHSVSFTDIDIERFLMMIMQLNRQPIFASIRGIRN